MNQGDGALFIQATIAMYRECIVRASQGLVKNWTILVGSIGAFFAFQFVAKIAVRLGILGQFMLGLTSCALISLYYLWISDTIQRDRLTLKRLINFDWNLFFSVVSVSFILFLVAYLIRPMAQSESAIGIVMVVNLGLVFIFNALPEVMYIHRYESISAFSEAARFTKENWIEWYIPFVVLLLPWIFLSRNAVEVVLEFASMSPLLPTGILLFGWAEIFPGMGLIGTLIGLVIANWFMIFRGILFEELESGSRRRRVYLAKQK